MGPVSLCCPELEREKQTRQYADLISRGKSGVAISQVHHREILKFMKSCNSETTENLARKLKLHCTKYDTMYKSSILKVSVFTRQHSSVIPRWWQGRFGR